MNRWPAEWEPHSRTLLSWPVIKDDWVGDEQEIDDFFATLACKIAESEPVLILNISSEFGSELLRRYPQLNQSNIELSSVVTNSIWVRDFGPLWVSGEREALALNPTFNGWALYDGHGDDNAVVAQLHPSEVTDLEWGDRHVVLEGGSIDGNGAGVLLTSEQCLLNTQQQRRNPGFSKLDYEAMFLQRFGATNVLWTKDGLLGDDTNGHIDDVARFVNEATILFARATDSSNPNYKILEESRRALCENIEVVKGSHSSSAQKGAVIEVVDLPLPDPVLDNGAILPASYANFYITNSSVLVPVFMQENDDKALGIIRQFFPGRNVIGLDSRVLVRGLGGIHCSTMQEPLI